MYKLLARPGWGSAIVEAQLALAGLPHAIEDLDPRGSPADRERLRTLNPLLQIPTLILPDGAVMTESAAITLHIADRAPATGLVPPAGDPTRDAFLRWLIFLVANVYPTFTVADGTGRWVSGESAQRELLDSTNRYREQLWRVVGEAAGPGPWLLGERFSALDVYVAVMTRWQPRRDWFAANLPRLRAIAEAVDAMPALARVWRRNFG